MQRMFGGASFFNCDISTWHVSSVTDMNNMFYDAASFNSDISKWDVSSVTDMAGMFYLAALFDVDISKWDVSEVKYMNSMFRGATFFNRDISKWDVLSSVINMNDMFSGAESFEKVLYGAAWVRSKASKNRMFKGSPGSISETVTHQYVSRRPITERELIARAPTTTSLSTPVLTSVIGSMMACPTCGTFKKSGRVSCCAPGGAWYKNCGGAGSRNADHRWFEGFEACKFTTTTISSACPKCGTIK